MCKVYSNCMQCLLSPGNRACGLEPDSSEDQGSCPLMSNSPALVGQQDQVFKVHLRYMRQLKNKDVNAFEQCSGVIF